MIGEQNTHIFRCGMNVLVFIPELILAIAPFFKHGLPKSSVIICASASKKTNKIKISKINPLVKNNSYIWCGSE